MAEFIFCCRRRPATPSNTSSMTPKAILNYNTGLYSLGLLLVLSFQSCSTELHLQASVEDGHQTYSGPSYGSASSPDKGNLGWNLGLIWIGIPESPENYRKHPGNTYIEQSGNLYASNLRGPAAFDYSNWNNSKKNAQAARPVAFTGFLSHLTYMGGIEFVQKNSSDGGSKITLNYLQVPVYALYQTKLSSGSIFGGLGPYLAYGIGGKTTSTFNGHTEEIKSFNSTTGFKRFDAGLGLTAGYKLPKSFYFTLAFNLGLVNIERNSFGDKAKNTDFSLNVGYPIDRIIKRK